jgi:DNA-binding transcriptional regulator YiaG
MENKSSKMTADEKRFITSLEQGLKHAKGQKTRGVIVERHALRATKDDVKEFRKRLHLTQAQCALVLDVNLETVKKWEQGMYQVPGPASQWIRAAQRKPGLVAELLREQIHAF